ncbi:MAG: putative bifunctional diguanylate cyclase/phosphodiesterase [Sphingomonadales bacterium]
MTPLLPGRFQTRLVLLFVSLFVLVQIGTYAAVYLVTDRNLEGQARQHLMYSADTFSRAMRERTDKLAEGARVLSNDFGFRQAVATEDTATVISALSNLASRIGAQRAMLISLEQAVLADNRPVDALTGRQFPMAKLIDHADEHGKSAAFIELNGQLYDFVLVPVLAPVPIAWVGLGIRLDDREAASIRQLMPQGIDISFLHHDGGGGWTVLASTLKLKAADVSRQLAGDREALKRRPVRLSLGGEDYLGLTVDLPDDAGAGGTLALLQYSFEAAYSPYRTLIYALAVLLAIGLVALAYGSVGVARSVSRPLRELAEAAIKVARGEYRPVALKGSRDEIGQLASSFNRMIENIEEREQKITFQAEHDAETGLPNLRRFEADLQRCIDEGGGTASVVVVAVERVNEVRNTFGYATWERLIALIAPRLRDSAPHGALLARVSTSSFIIGLPGLDTLPARRVAERILSGFEQPFTIDAFTIDSNAHLGVASHPEHGATAEQLIQRASTAVIQARSGGGHVAVYDPERDSNTAGRLSLMGDLRKGLANREVQFHYQPKIDLATNRMTHVEALVRWRHPTLGFLPPAEFIGLAEQTGHIGYLTAWALETAIGQCGAWRRQGHAINTAVNLSAHDLTDRTLPLTVARLLRQHQVHPSWIALELTESAVMQNPEQAIAVLQELRQMQVGLSVDDYGTGYSSLAYLKKLPINELKVDRSFVLNLAQSGTDQILVRSTVELAHSLGLKVTAEGVEDAASADLLRGFGCDMAQGYYFSKPIPADELDRFIRQSPYGLAAAGG